ncbi:MAG: Do family serine endopeptidase [Gammaproteobacteria bacterium]|nr:MAG: Do family serine endopeptidase [Gammaproteobacteria bacterium]
MVAAPACARSLPDFTGLVEQVAPGVVNIQSMTEGHEGAEQPDFLKRFFGMPHDLPSRPSTGSGFIVSPDGVILTNWHVVAQAERIRVRLSDRREFQASLLGKDERSDLAVLKVEGEQLPVVKIGRSQNLKVGEWVLAIGSPFGFEHSVTAGIVSALGRSLPNENYVPFIQTDVAINPGNSGGPLFNLEGEVVGINAQIYTRSGGFMGVSFAIPIDTAMQVVAQLQDGGTVHRGWLGVVIEDVDANLASEVGLERPAGARVRDVLDGSPADAGGLKVGDIILDFNGTPVERSNALPPLVGGTRPGDEVRLKVWREGEAHTLLLALGELDAGREGAAGMDSSLSLSEVPEAQLEQSGLSWGLRVDGVQPDSPWAMHLQPGDILLLANGQPLKRMDDWPGLPAHGERLRLRIWRQGQLLWDAVRGPLSPGRTEPGE